MDQTSISITNFVKDRVHRDVKYLFLNFLYILEDLEKTGKITEDEYFSFRKRVLDYGNNTIRNLQEQLDSFDIRIKADDNSIQQGQKKEDQFNR